MTTTVDVFGTEQTSLRILARVRPREAKLVATRLKAFPDIVVGAVGPDAFSVILLANSAEERVLQHQEIASWPEVEQTVAL